MNEPIPFPGSNGKKPDFEGFVKALKEILVYTGHFETCDYLFGSKKCSCGLAEAKRAFHKYRIQLGI